MMAVTPGISRISRWICVQLVAVVDRHAVGRSRAVGYFSGSSVTTAIFLTPSAASWCAIIGTLSGPSTGWPPVMATASLNRIL